MKKSVFALISVLALAAICMCACYNHSTVLDNIAEDLQQGYSNVKVHTMVDVGGSVLRGVYDISLGENGSTVAYEYDRFAKFTIGEDGITSPDGYIQHVTGTVTIADGKIVEGDKSAELPIAYGSMRFSKDYLSDIEISNVRLTAKVSDPSGFLGTSIRCRDMQVMVMYGKTVEQINLTYTTSSGASVEIVYQFTK